MFSIVLNLLSVGRKEGLLEGKRQTAVQKPREAQVACLPNETSSNVHANGLPQPGGAEFIHIQSLCVWISRLAEWTHLSPWALLSSFQCKPKRRKQDFWIHIALWVESSLLLRDSVPVSCLNGQADLSYEMLVSGDRTCWGEVICYSTLAQLQLDIFFPGVETLE